MSMAVLLLAKRDALRMALGSIIPGGSERAVNYIDIMPDGRPPTMMGDWFVGLDELQVRSSDKTFLKETYATRAIITRRAAQQPKDRYGSLYAETGSGLDAIERAVIVAVHGNQALRTLANTLLGAPSASAGDGFIMPLWYTGRGPTRPESGDWIGCEPDRGAFLVRELMFEGGNRIQALDVMQ